MPLKDQLKYYDDWGSDKTFPHYAVGWAWAFDTPFKWTKQVASHFGGTRQGMVMSWPARIKDAGGIRHQFHHVIDIVPTILEATGITGAGHGGRHPAEADRRREHGLHLGQGQRQRAVDAQDAVLRDAGRCAASTTTAGWRRRRRPSSRGRRSRACRRSSPKDILNGYNWELYKLADDPTQADDIAPRTREKLAEMKKIFMEEAAKYNVLPLDNRSLSALPRAEAERDRRPHRVHLHRRARNTPKGGAPSFLDRSYKITAEVEIPQGGAEGMLVTDGGRFGGIGFYLLKGKPVFVYNFVNVERFRWEGKDALAPGKHTLVFDFKYDGIGFGLGGKGTLKVDGKVVDAKKIPKTMPFMFPEDETFDVGVDTRTPIDDHDYQVPFRFTGKLNKLTVELEPIKGTIAQILEFKWKTRD